MCKRLFFAIYIILGLGYLSSCQENDFLSDQQDAVIGMEGEVLSKSCTLYLEGSYPAFDDEDGTRASSGRWDDGDVVYILLSNGVYGKGVYSASSQSWSFSYNGTLSETDGASCKVYHCPGAKTEDGTTVLQLDEKNPVFSDEGATYVYQQETNELSIQASLEPIVWRMRFAEDYYASPITVYANENVTYPSALDFSTGTLSVETGKRYVGHDETSYGYSSYIYAMPLSRDTDLSLEIDYKIYERTLSAANTVRGASGRFTRPTQSSHNGWIMRDLPVALISNGKEFNDKIDFLVNGQDPTWAWVVDTLITQIVFDYNSDVTTGTVVSSEESGIPIYANFSNGVMTISTSAAEIHLGQDASGMFSGCSSLTSLDLSSFNTDNVTNMGAMFGNCSSLTSLELGRFNTENVTDMSGMFMGCNSLTSLDVSNFNTGNVTSMSDMFWGCSSLTSLDLSNFNTGNVTYMVEMFRGCSSLTSLNVSGFDTSNVTNMSWMFDDCSSLTGLDLSNFDTRNVTSMMAVFANCYVLTSLDVSNFDTSNVTDMSAMFQNCYVLTSLDVSHFDTRNVTNMDGIFHGCRGLISLDVSHFDTSNVISMDWMFSDCSSLTSLDVSHFDTSNVTGMERMFYGCYGLTSLDVSHFDTSNVISMYWMFFDCSSLTSLDVSHFDTRNVTDMSAMFGYCSGLTSLDVSNFDTSNVTDMYAMFQSCYGLTSLDVSHFDTRNVTDMSAMFGYCSGLTSLDVSHFDTSNVTDMRSMFSNCSSLTSLDLSNFNTGNVTKMGWMFYGCSGLTSLDLSNFNTGNVTSMSDMFYGCSGLTSLDLGKNFVIETGTDAFSMAIGLASDSKSCTISCIAATKDALESGTALNSEYISWNILY